MSPRWRRRSLPPGARTSDDGLPACPAHYVTLTWHTYCTLAIGHAGDHYAPLTWPNRRGTR